MEGLKKNWGLHPPNPQARQFNPCWIGCYVDFATAYANIYGIRNIVCTIVHVLASPHVCAPASVHRPSPRAAAEAAAAAAAFAIYRCDAESQSGF